MRLVEGVEHQGPPVLVRRVVRYRRGASVRSAGVRPPVATHTVPVGSDRMVTIDEVGDRGGVPVVYLHGTPESRLARHPDDGLAAAAGVRLLAVDRPGYGWSSPLPRADRPRALADALASLGVERAAVLAWSGGTLDALALALGAPDRVAALGVVSGVVPAEAFCDPDVRRASPVRHGLVDLATEVPPGELGSMVAPLLAPYPCDTALAAEHQAEQRTPSDAAEIASVPGATERLAASLVEAVRAGLDGVAADLEAQARPSDLDLAAIGCPTRLWYGSNDDVTPPALGRWLADRIPHARLEVVDGAGHYLVLTRWERLLAEVAELV